MLAPDGSAGPPTARTIAWRTAALALSAIVVVPAALLHGYLLLWFLPEATGYTCDAADELSCRYEPANTVYFWLLLASIVVSMVSLGLSWWRRWYAGPWWQWPALALAAVPLCVLLGTLLVG